MIDPLVTTIGMSCLIIPYETQIKQAATFIKRNVSMSFIRKDANTAAVPIHPIISIILRFLLSLLSGS